jgi:hypothetical protein
MKVGRKSALTAYQQHGWLIAPLGMIGRIENLSRPENNR